MYPLKTKTKYNPSNLAASANTFTTVYLGNYVSGNFSENVGSHPGVDIVPIMPHDDVFAILDGTVHFAWTNASNGNYVVLKHTGVPDPADLTKTTNLFSVYLHLNELTVSTGQIVAEGDVIGKSGTTGNSTGEHLHFQIDREDAPFHPYWPFTFAEAKEKGMGFFEATNVGLGMDNARKYTVNPLVYLDALESGVSSVAVSSTKIASGEVDVNILKPTAETAKVPTFSDVSPTYQYGKAIEYIASKNIATGDGGKFNPEKNITRAELLKMVFRAGNIPLESVSGQMFSDVPTDSWFAPYVATAKKRSIVGGYADGTFKPNNPVTRAEAFKIIINTLAKDSIDTVSFQIFSDVGTDAWYAPYANFAKTNELINFDDNVFHPDVLMKRAEVASALYVILETVLAN